MDSDDGSGGGGGGGDDESNQPKPKLADLINDYGLQDELNTMMAANRKKLTQQNSELVTQLEELKRNQHLTQEQRDELQTRITQLEEQYMTKEELAKREASKAQKAFEDRLNSANAEKEQWYQRYSESTIDRALQDAAIDGEAIRPSQIVDLLRQKTQLSEVTVNGSSRYEPTVKFNDVNEDGESVVLDLSPADAIKRMKELRDEYGNLFKGTATGGIGGAKGADGSAPSPKLEELLKDPVKYAEWRKNNPDLDITKLR